MQWTFSCLCEIVFFFFFFVIIYFAVMVLEQVSWAVQGRVFMRWCGHCVVESTLARDRRASAAPRSLPSLHTVSSTCCVLTARCRRRFSDIWGLTTSSTVTLDTCRWPAEPLVWTVSYHHHCHLTVLLHGLNHTMNAFHPVRRHSVQDANILVAPVH